jgi:hypothetical protein
MRFILMANADSTSEAGGAPNLELMAAIGQLAEEWTRAGLLVGTGGLLPSSSGARLPCSGGELTVIDGPFPETKELIAGYAIVDVKSKAEAIELASRFMLLHREILGPTWEGRSEIRQMYDDRDVTPCL